MGALQYKIWNTYWKEVRKSSPEVDGIFGDLMKGFPFLLSFSLLPLPSLTSPLHPLSYFGCWGGHGSFTGKKEGSVGAPWLWIQQRWFCDCIRSWWHPFLQKFLTVKTKLQPIRRQGLQKWLIMGGLVYSWRLVVGRNHGFWLLWYLLSEVRMMLRQSMASLWQT